MTLIRGPYLSVSVLQYPLVDKLREKRREKAKFTVYLHQTLGAFSPQHTLAGTELTRAMWQQDRQDLRRSLLPHDILVAVVPGM